MKLTKGDFVYIVGISGKEYKGDFLGSTEMGLILELHGSKEEVEIMIPSIESIKKSAIKTTTLGV